MALNDGNNEKVHSLAHMLNMSFDRATQMLMFFNAGYDGQNIQLPIAGNILTKTYESGTTSYYCIAAPGTSLSTEKWLVMKEDEDGNITYADGDTNFDNAATDLSTVAAYSYS